MAYRSAVGDIEIVTSRLGSFLSRLLGLPSTATSPAALVVQSVPGEPDRWIRTFRRKGRTTRVAIVGDEFIESVGPSKMYFSLRRLDAGCELRSTHVGLGPVKLPIPMAIHLDASTKVSAQSMKVDVHLYRQRPGREPSTIVRYFGTMRPND